MCSDVTQLINASGCFFRIFFEDPMWRPIIPLLCRDRPGGLMFDHDDSLFSSISYDVSRKSQVNGNELVLDSIRILAVLTDATADLCHSQGRWPNQWVAYYVVHQEL